MSEACCELSDTHSTQTSLKPDFNLTSKLKHKIKKKISTLKHSNSNQINVTHSDQIDLRTVDFVPKPHKSDKKYYDVKNGPECYRKLQNRNSKKKNTSDNVSYEEIKKNIVLQWLQDLVVLSNNNNDIVKEQKDNTINSLIDEINEMQFDINYDSKFKLLISKYIDSLHIYQPETKRDQVSFKKQYILDLLESIKGIQLKNYSKQADDNNYPRNVTKNDQRILENEINKELIKVHIKINNIEDNNWTTDKQNKLDNSVNKPRCNVCFQKVLQEDIYDVINYILLCLNYSPSKDFINKVAKNVSRKMLVTLKSNKYTRKLTYDEIQRMVFQKCTKEVFNSMSKTLEIKDEVDNTNYSSGVIKDVRQNNHKDPEMGSRYNESYYNYNQNGNLFQVAENISRNKNINIADFPGDTLPIKFTESRAFRAISIYMSEDLIKYPLTSTPKKPTISKDAIPKLSAGEISYMKSLADVIKEWIKTLPIQLDDPESLQFKEVIINDLAGSIVFEVKKHQLAPSDDLEYEIKSLIFLWLNRFAIYDNPDDKDVAIDRLYTEIIKISIPSLTLPQYGTRKRMKAIQFQEEEDSDPLMEYIPKGIDVIEDEISMWMNEQPEKIFVYDNRMDRNDMIHKLAEILEQHLLRKHTEKEIEKDVAKWLHEIIKHNEKVYIDQLIEELRDRVKNLPQEETLRREYKERLEVMHRKKLLKENAKEDDTSTFFNDYNDPNETMKEFLEKFIQHNYDVDDSLARNAFSYLLKKELVRINPPTRKEIYDNFAKSEDNPLFERTKFVHELEYIKLISDWLKRIPVTPPYNRIKNKHRIYFIHNLAKYIAEIEEERAKTPDVMDYDLYLYSIIRAYVAHLPISTDKTEHIKQMNALIVDLVNIIIRYRLYIQSKRANRDVSFNNLGEFVNEFIDEHGKDLRDDPLKLEVWMDRLMVEIQKLVRNTSDPAILGRSQLYKKLAGVPIPNDESIELFNTKLVYVKEITDWLKNLPLKENVVLAENSELVKMISELSEKIIERETMKLRGPGDARADTDFIEFLKQWIAALPLDIRQEIIVPVVIQQIMNRIDKVHRPNKQKNDAELIQIIEEGNENMKPHGKSVIKISPKEPKSEQNPENAIIEAVEKFCNALLVNRYNEDRVKATKDKIIKKLLQKISKLNIDPTVFNDELLFKEMFRDEIDRVLENIPQDIEFLKNKEILKNTLIDSVVNLRNVIKEQSAGENYKQKLENTIEASIPNPVQNIQIYDPGFEFYKNRLATMFILENFHHADEDIKLKYEKRIQSEVDKYFEYAQNRNAIPLSKDRIQNELYDALFKVPIPNEASIAGEVEAAKTRFEIDAWYELLPLIPANTLDELLERDRVLSSLAKRIHEIERVEKNSDSKIQKEIIKYLTMLPLLPGNEQNFERFATYLQNRLKSTIKDRKSSSKEICVEIGKRKNKWKLGEIQEKDQLSTHKAVDLVRQPPIYNQMPFISQKPAADLILEVVEGWCNQLPIISNTPAETANARNIKDNLAIKIVLKISELNSDPEIFDDEYGYDAMLDQEIDKLTYNLPIFCDYLDKEARKIKLKEKIRSIKPVIVMERQKHEYKEVLEQSVISFWEECDDRKELAPPKELIQKIVDDFLEYYYNKDDVEERNVYKSNMHETVVKNLSIIKDKLGKELAIDPFILRNQLICKLSKVPVPSKKALQNIITEIRMKKEVEDLFQKLSLYKQDNFDMEMVQIMKLNLAKKLCYLEQYGHDPTVDIKMTKEISKYLKKLNTNIDPDMIKIFVEQLRNNEIFRKTSPQAAGCSHDHHRNTVHSQDGPQIIPPTVISNLRPSQIITETISSVPITTEACVTRRQMEIPPRDILRLQKVEQVSTEASDDSKRCKCVKRKINKRKRVCTADRNFDYNHLFRRPVIPMWCRFPQLGFYF